MFKMENDVIVPTPDCHAKTGRNFFKMVLFSNNRGTDYFSQNILRFHFAFP